MHERSRFERHIKSRFVDEDDNEETRRVCDKVCVVFVLSLSELVVISRVMQILDGCMGAIRLKLGQTI